jgi:hypothetical protein
LLSKQSAWLRSPAVKRIHSHLGRRDPKKLFRLAHLIGSLSPAEREAFRAASRSLKLHRQPTEPQKELLEQIATAFEAGRTSLKGGPRDDKHRR